MKSGLLLGALIISGLGAAQAATYGKLEHVQLYGGGKPLEVSARLDPQAGQSILSATDVKYFNKENELWVRFTVDNGSVLPGNHIVMQRPLLKDVRIKQNDGATEHRPLIDMDICVGEQNLKVQLSVRDRTGYTASLVLGKSDLEKIGATITEHEFTREPSCQPPGSEAPIDVTTVPKGDAKASTAHPAATPSVESVAQFSCDGRTTCPQMHSCEEAKFFIKNCPNTKMDGNHDGIPCEQQWCH